MEGIETRIYLPWETDNIHFVEGDWIIYRGQNEGTYRYSIGGIDGNIECDAKKLIEYGMAERINCVVSSPWPDDQITFKQKLDLTIIRNLGDSNGYYLLDRDGCYYSCNCYYLVQKNLASINEECDFFLKPILEKAHSKEPKFDYSLEGTPWEEHGIYFYSIDGLEFKKYKNSRGEHLYWVIRGSTKSIYKREDLLRHDFAVTKDDYFNYLVKKAHNELCVYEKVDFSDVVKSVSKVVPFIDEYEITGIPSIISAFEQLISLDGAYSMMIEDYYRPQIEQVVTSFREVRDSFGEPEDTTSFIEEIKEKYASAVQIYESIDNYSKKTNKITADYILLSFIHFIKKRELREMVALAKSHAYSEKKNFDKVFKEIKDKTEGLRYFSESKKVNALFSQKSKSYIAREYNSLIKEIGETIRNFFCVMDMMYGDEVFQFIIGYQHIEEEINEFIKNRKTFMKFKKDLKELEENVSKAMDNIARNHKRVN